MHRANAARSSPAAISAVTCARSSSITACPSQLRELERGVPERRAHGFVARSGRRRGRDAVAEGNRVIIADDLLATGGTAKAVCQLVERLGGRVEGLVFVVELEFLPGRKKLEGYDVRSLIKYQS